MRSWPVAVSLAAVGAMAGWSLRGVRSDTALPDVILITLDTTRADALGCYGAPDDRSPHLDALAREGVLFERCATSSAITPPAHASILTGLQPYQHGLRVFSGHGGYRLPADVPTLATVLRDRGYTTAAVHSAFPVSAAFGFERGFEVFESFGAGFISAMAAADEGLGKWSNEDFQRRSDATIDLALDVLDAAEGPLFLWVHLFDPHDLRVQPPPEFSRAEVADLPENAPGRRDALYSEEVRYQDAQLGRLFAGLRRHGRYENALIAVVADHGEGLSDGVARHGWSKHSILYDEQLHVPLVMRGPGLPAGRRVTSLVRTVDLLPTLLELLETPAPRPLAGESLLPLLDGAADEHDPRTVYAEQLAGYELPRPPVLRSRPHDDFVYCVNDGAWKLLYRPAHPHRSELFQVARDPREEQNLFGQREAEGRRLLRDLAARDPWVDRPFEERAGDTDPDIAHALLALGYAEAGSANELVGPRWEWLCLAGCARGTERGPCPNCGAPRVLIVAGASLFPSPEDPGQR